MVTDCNDDDGNDEDVGVGWDEECFSLFSRRITDKCTYCNPAQTERFLSQRSSSLFCLIQSHCGLALGGGVWRESPSKILEILVTIGGSK